MVVCADLYFRRKGIEDFCGEAAAGFDALYLAGPITLADLRKTCRWLLTTPIMSNSLVILRERLSVANRSGCFFPSYEETEGIACPGSLGQ